MSQPNRESVDARYVPPEEYFDGLPPVGTFTIKDCPAGEPHLYARLPGPCNACCPVGKGGWTWNGSLDKPTLSPSVKVSGGRDGRELWHGWLRDGRFVSC